MQTTITHKIMRVHYNHKVGCEMAYFDYASVGVPDPTIMQEGKRFLEKLPEEIEQGGGDYTLRLLGLYEETRQKIADTYQVPKRNIAFIQNTTEGLGIIANALYQSLEKVHVLVPDIDFISSSLVWKQNSDSIEYVKSAWGCVSPTAIVNQMKEHTNVLCLSSVQEVSGYRISFQDLLKKREKRDDEYWIIDGIQEAGIFHRNLVKDQIDAYIVGGHKWLSCPFGIGFMYVSDRLLNKISPAYYGYFNLNEPEIGWVDYLESRERSLQDSFTTNVHASNLEPGGMINAFGALMLGQSFSKWNTFGIEKASSAIIEKQQRIRDWFEGIRSCSVLGSDRSNDWSGIVTVTHQDGIQKEKEIMRRLQEAGIKASLRSIEGVGGIRLSVHYETTERQIEELLAPFLWE
ncbi:aminotransferase class V-fold PLP-dependent enzyme [Pontibacillus marinus]|nr:aminotransferase class V-fold PLP-dependent enzyme [Pontibacillus marinus]